MEQKNDALKERYRAALRALFDKKYQNLTPEQREAVYSINGPLLILAGAGSGKTTVLVNRIAYMIRFGNAYYGDFIPEGMNEEGIRRLEEAKELDGAELDAVLSELCDRPCPPWAVLAITFTNKAANEMKNRLAGAIGEYAKDIWAGTFHSICLRILRKYGERIGIKPGFTIYDTEDTKKAIQHCMTELNIDEKMLAPKTAQNLISRAKDELKTPEDFLREVSAPDYKGKQVAKVYAAYQKKMEDSNVVDFDDIIMKTVQLLTADEEARDYYQHRFTYVSVDEFQDTNVAQFRLVRLLSGFHHNLMAVGDDDQSIYKFRGATIENILSFDRELTDAKVVKLEQNFRSTQIILDAANAVIGNNTKRHEKKLWTDKGADEQIIYKRCDTQNEEARYLVNKVVELSSREKRKYSDFAILYRMNAQSNALESAFSRSGIPYRILGGTRYYERKEIKDILAYLCLVNNTADRMRLRRIINEPKRKIGETTVNTVEEIANLENTDMFSVMKDAAQYPSLVKAAPRLREFTDLIDGLRRIALDGKISDLIRATIEKTGYQTMLLLGGEEGIERLQNIQELISNAIEYEQNHTAENGDYDGSLTGFLEEVALVSDIDNYDSSSDAVVMMTVHSAKGLEFPVVMLPGFEEGIFPGYLSTTSDEELEEERRLAYVAITRAKERIFICTARERMMFGRTNMNRPSRFFEEIPEELVKHTEYTRSSTQHVNAAAQYRAHMVEEFNKKPTVTESPIRPIVSAARELFEVGNTVMHPTFGKGVILSVSKMGADLLYEVMFDSVGTKKMMASYAKLTRA